MKNTLGTKLIIVMNSIKMILYEAQGTKITNDPIDILDLTLAQHPHHIIEKHDSFFKKQSNPGSVFEPRTLPKQLEYQEASKMAAAHLTKITNNDHSYKELIIIAEPKMLGYVRNSLNEKIKKLITKELSKDLVSYDRKTIEQAAFA